MNTVERMIFAMPAASPVSVGIRRRFKAAAASLRRHFGVTSAPLPHQFGTLRITIIKHSDRHARTAWLFANARAEQAYSPHTELNRPDELE
jgi:hypothetical protein